MTQKYSTKRAIVASILVLCLCVTSFIGTTFAWFTDSVSSDGNIIQTGTLDVEMHWADGGKAVPTDKTGWTNAADGWMFNNTKWEPGYAEAKHIKISNVGTLALKYQLRIVSSSELTALANVIDVYYYDEATALTRDSLAESDRLGTLAEVMDPTHAKALYKTVRGSLEAGGVTTLTLVLKMRDEAGNEYQNLALNGGFSIQLLAAQYNSEDDSFGTDYDVNAQYPVVTTPAYVLPTEKFAAFNFNTTDMKVTAPADLAADLANDGVTAVTFKASDVVVKDGVATIASAEFYDQNGNVIDLTDYNEPIEVKLYVGDAYKGQNVVVSHDGYIVAATKVDAEGYVTYKTSHFCEITIELDKEIPEGAIIVGGEVVDPDEVEDIDLNTLVTMTVGTHAYTVSYGMASSWYEYPNVPGKIEADIYLPEDLYAFAMMYKNGDLTETYSHSDLEIKADLDFKNKKWEPIGRFFTNVHGNDHKVSNLSDSFFGCVYDCQVYDLTLENVNVAASAAGVLAKEFAGDAYAVNVTIAGNNTVTFVDDGKANWPEFGYGIGAVCGVSVIGCSAPANVNVAITGTVTLNYGENAIFYNASGMENIGISKEFGLNVYAPNVGANVTGSENITVNGSAYMLVTEVVDGKVQYVDGLAVNGKTYALLNEAGFEWFADYVKAGNTTKGYTFNLLCNVDLAGKAWEPLGNDDAPFKGTFDANGFTISNLTVSDYEFAAFFNYTSGATLKNINFVDANVSGKYASVLVAQAGSTTIDNVKVLSGTVNGTSYASGLIAQQAWSSVIKNCVNYVDVTSKISSGIGGYIWYASTVENCVNYGDITGSDRAGGIVAHAGGTFTNCVNHGDVVSNGGMPVGGIAGVVNEATTFDGCVNNGDVTNTGSDVYNSNAGGIFGQSTTTTTVKNSVNNGDVVAESVAAAGIGVSHYGALTVTSCVNNGDIYGNKSADATASTKGMFGGTNTVTDCINAGQVVKGLAATDAASLAAAIEKLISGGTIVLKADVTLDESIVIPEGKTVVLDLCGYTITGATSSALLTNEGTLTLTGGTIENTAFNGGATISNKGTMVLADVNVIGAPIAAESGYPAYCISNSANLTVEDGTVVTADRGCMFVSGTGATVINGGSFTNNDIAPKLSGRSFTSHVVVIGYGANNKLTINDGEFNHLHTSTSGGVVINNWSAVTVDIKGGNFSGGNYFGKWDNLSDYGYGSTKTPFAVTGGTFTGMDNKFLAEGYAAYKAADGTYVVASASAAVVTTVDELKAALGQGGTIIFANDITVTDKWDSRYIMTKTNTVNIDGMGYTLKIAGKVNDGYNYNSVLRFVTDATVKNLTMDLSEVVNDGRWLRAISSYGNLTVDNCTFIGPNDAAISTTRAIEYGDMSGAAGKLDLNVVITNSTFTGWAKAISDNESGTSEVATVVVEGNTINCSVSLSAHESIEFNNNVCTGKVDLLSYLNGAELTVAATGNTLNANAIKQIGTSKCPVNAANVTAQDDFTVNAK